MARNCWAHQRKMQVPNDDCKHEQKHCVWKQHNDVPSCVHTTPQLHAGQGQPDQLWPNSWGSPPKCGAPVPYQTNTNDQTQQHCTCSCTKRCVGTSMHRCVSWEIYPAGPATGGGSPEHHGVNLQPVRRAGAAGGQPFADHNSSTKYTQNTTQNTPKAVLHYLVQHTRAPGSASIRNCGRASSHTAPSRDLSKLRPGWPHRKNPSLCGHDMFYPLAAEWVLLLLFWLQTAPETPTLPPRQTSQRHMNSTQTTYTAQPSAHTTEFANTKKTSQHDRYTWCWPQYDNPPLESCKAPCAETLQRSLPCPCQPSQGKWAPPREHSQ